MNLLAFAAMLPLTAMDMPKAIDLTGDPSKSFVIDKEPGQYLGHVSSVLLEDAMTVLIVYPKGHGRGAIVYQRSSDGGRTWSGRLPTPRSWGTSLETPTIHRVIDPQTGHRSLILWSGLYPARIARSEDDGQTWSELEQVGDWGGIVVMGSVERLKDGRYAAFFHDDGRFFSRSGGPRGFKMYQTFSSDAGRTWSFPEVIWAGADMDLCEPGAIRSPDGSTLALLLRENRRVKPSHVMFTRDEAKTWTEPRPMHPALTGDRHTLRYLPDGRVIAVFRDMMEGPWKGDFIAWVGTWQDIVLGRPGQLRIRLLDNQDSWDSSYPGLEMLRDGTILAITYGHWTKGEQPYIMGVRLTMEDLPAPKR